MPRRFIVSLTLVAVLCLAASAQQQPPQPTPPPQHSPPPATAIAATVNGIKITELAVFRGLIGVSTDKRDELRGEVLNYLIENALLDEYLDQMKIEVEAKDIDGHVAKLKTEIEAKGQKLEDVYKQLVITEADLRTQIRATLRWDKFIQQYATEKAVKDFFDGNKAIFDGSAVHAKHILIAVPPGGVQAAEDAKAKVVLLKQQIETQVAQQLAAAGNQDNLKLQKMRMELLEASFAAVATKESTCPTKSSGGDLGWFPRAGGGRVTEAFAKEAFGLKPFEMSGPVATEYGYHLILCVDYKAGNEPKFETIREVVRDVYAGKMRDAIVARMKPAAKIVINPAPK